MSFITKDPQLLKQLVKIVEGQAKPAPLPAPAAPPLPTPAPTATPAAPATPLGIAKHMFVLLGQNLNGMPNLGYAEGGQEKGPEVKDLQNIDMFTQYLESTKLTIDGKRLAYSPQDLSAMKDPVVQKEYGSLGTKVGDPEKGGANPDTRRWAEADYKVYFPGVTKYLGYLQRKAFNEGNKVLEVMVGKLIDSANKYYDTGLTRTPKHVPGQAPSELPPTTPVDSFPNGYVLDPWSKKYENGPTNLTAADLKDAGSLNNWLTKNGIKVRTAAQAAADAAGKTQAKTTVDLPISDPNVDFCNMINAMYWRAKYLLQRQTNEAEKRNAGFYLRKMQELASSYSSPDGKACSITDTTAVPGAGGTQPGSGSEAGSASARALYDLLNSLPFREENVNIRRIQYFNNMYLKMTSGDHYNYLSGWINKINSQILSVQDMASEQGIESYPLRVGTGYAEELAGYAKHPDAQNFKPLVSRLIGLVNLEKSIVRNILDAYGGGGRGGSPDGVTVLKQDQIATVTNHLRLADDNVRMLNGAIFEWDALPGIRTGKK